MEAIHSPVDTLLQKSVVQKAKEICSLIPELELLAVHKICKYIKEKKEELLKNAPSLETYKAYDIYVSKSRKIYLLLHEKQFILGKGQFKTVYLGVDYIKEKLIAHCSFDDVDQEFNKEKAKKKLTRSDQTTLLEKIQVKRQITLAEINILNVLKIDKLRPGKTTPGILKLVEDDECGKKTQLVFKYYNLGDLENVMKEMKLTPHQKIKIARDLILGVYNTHSQAVPVQHNDIKESNILVKLKIDGNIKTFKSVLSDYGHHSQGEGPGMYTFGGSPHYYSPEKLRAIDCEGLTGHITYEEGLQSDIWALGCVLYNLFFETCPWFDTLEKLGRKNIFKHPNYAADVVMNCVDEQFRKFSSDIGNLIDEMLDPNGNQRITAKESLISIEKLLAASTVPRIQIPNSYPSTESLDSEDASTSTSRDTSSKESSRGVKTKHSRFQGSKSISEICIKK